jgi:DNA-binding NarL/FixJ family response regulator
MSGRARVIVADDHAPSRQRVRLALEAGGFLIVGEAATAAGAVEAALAMRPDVAVLDLYMDRNPQTAAADGIDAARLIRARLPETTVVMLTVSAAREDLVGALRAGAAGYLLKGRDARRLPDDLRAVLAGDQVVPHRLVPHLVDELREQGRRPRAARWNGAPAVLSPRESEVVELLAGGLSTQEVARELGITAVTVRRHAAAATRKLGAADRLAALRIVQSMHDVRSMER